MATMSAATAAAASARLTASAMKRSPSAAALPRLLPSAPMAQLRSSASSPCLAVDSAAPTAPAVPAPASRSPYLPADPVRFPLPLTEMPAAGEAESAGEEDAGTPGLPFPREGYALAFVYGTLKKGFGNHWLMTELMESGDAIKIGSARTCDRFPLVCGPFQVPFLLHRPGEGHRVVGEVYEVNRRAVERLDVLEGTDRGHYVRCPVMLSDVHVSATYAAEHLAGESEMIKQGSDEGGAPVVLRAEAYFAGVHHTPGLAMADPIESYDARAAATYVPRKLRPEGKTFLEHVHSWIDEKKLLRGVSSEQYKWPQSVI